MLRLILQQKPSPLSLTRSQSLLFSTSRIVAQSSPSAAKKLNLASVLSEELEYEKEAEGSYATEMPEDLKEWLKKSKFELVSGGDVDGMAEGKLVRQLGRERISIAFSIVPESTGELEDPYMDGEELAEEGSEEDEEDMSFGESESIRMTVDISKTDESGKDLGTLSFYAECQYDNDLTIDAVEFHKDSSVVIGDSDNATARPYAGPRFQDLDDNLTEAFRVYLEERGVDEDLCQFVTDFSSWKEQREYMNWLGSVKQFVESK